MNARALVKTVNMSRADWLRYRTMGIGGSDVSVIAGINPYKLAYQLWLEKTGQTEPAESENEYTHFGTVLEPVIRREFMERTGLKVRQKHMLLQSETYPFMLANLDDVVKVNGGIAPDIDGTKATTEYFNSKYNLSNGLAVKLPEELVSECEDYNRLADEIDRLTSAKDAVCNCIKNVLKENETGFAGKYKISWKQVISSKFNTTKFKADNPELYSKYLTSSQYRRFSLS